MSIFAPANSCRTDFTKVESGINECVLHLKCVSDALFFGNSKLSHSKSKSRTLQRVVLRVGIYNYRRFADD